MAMFEIFKNGSAKVNRRLLILELAMACSIVGVSMILGFIPSQKWIKSPYSEILSFGLAVVVVSLKSAEMFFNKAAHLFAKEREESLPSPPPLPLPPTQDPTIPPINITVNETKP